MLVARVGGKLAGYAMAFFPASAQDQAEAIEAGAPVDVVLEDTPREGELVYLSKLYVDTPWRGTGVFDILMREALAEVARRAEGGEPYVWLGTNTANKRAIRAYKRAGFRVVGAREFVVGEQINKDVTLAIRARVPQL